MGILKYASAEPHYGFSYLKHIVYPYESTQQEKENGEKGTVG